MYNMYFSHTCEEPTCNWMKWRSISREFSNFLLFAFSMTREMMTSRLCDGAFGGRIDNLEISVTVSL